MSMVVIKARRRGFIVALKVVINTGYVVMKNVSRVFITAFIVVLKVVIIKTVMVMKRGSRVVLKARV